MWTSFYLKSRVPFCFVWVEQRKYEKMEKWKSEKKLLKTRKINKQTNKQTEKVMENKYLEKISSTCTLCFFKCLLLTMTEITRIIASNMLHLVVALPISFQNQLITQRQAGYIGELDFFQLFLLLFIFKEGRF